VVVKDSEEIESRIDALYKSIGEDLAALNSAPPEEYRKLRVRLRRDLAEWRELCDRLFDR
jgi:hypothetical protein